MTWPYAVVEGHPRPAFLDAEPYPFRIYTIRSTERGFAAARFEGFTIDERPPSEGTLRSLIDRSNVFTLAVDLLQIKRAVLDDAKRPGSPTDRTWIFDFTRKASS